MRLEQVLLAIASHSVHTKPKGGWLQKPQSARVRTSPRGFELEPTGLSQMVFSVRFQVFACLHMCYTYVGVDCMCVMWC